MRFTHKCPVLLIAYVVLVFFQTQAQDYVDYAEQLGVNAIVSGSGSGSGLSTYDFDKDGLDDISICSSLGQMKFYHNVGNGFELLEYGIFADGLTEHLIWIDIENDGDLDIYFTTHEGRQFLYKNDGNFQFQEATASSGLPTYDAYYFGACFADYDLDGDLDLYTCKYNLVAVNPDDISQYNKLFQNQGDGTFVDVTIATGVYMPPTFSFQSTWLDYNEDGWPDLHVINDRNPVNFFFHNNGDGTFTEIANELDILFPSEDPMTNSVADFDHDGDLDIYMTNTGDASGLSHSLFLVNDGNDGFTEEATDYGIAPFVHGWGAVWVDSDNDSWQDLFFVTENNNPFYYYKNNQGESFTQSNSLISLGEYSTSYCPSRGDFNNDGYADIAVQSTSPHPPYVLMNQGGENNFIKITLAGTISNKEAVGSWVKVYSGESVYSEYTHCGENYLGQNSQHLIFGLGPDVLGVDSVKVIYPSRHIDTYYELLTDTAYYFLEGETYSCEITSSNTELSFCQGDSLFLDAGLHASYLWNTGDTSRTIWIYNSSDYVVTTQNSSGLFAKDTISITVNPNPNISAILTHGICHGDSEGSITLINQNDIPTQMVVWNDSIISDSLVNVPSGLYSYKYVDSNGCIAQGDVTLMEPSAMQFFATSTPEVSDSENGTISISVFGGTQPYQIYLDDSLVENELDGLSSGDYLFEIYDANQCKDSLIVTVGVVVGNFEYQKILTLIYPNPTSDFIQVESSEVLKEIRIVNSNGKTLKTFELADDGRYNLNDLPNGIYNVLLTYEDGSQSTHKISKM